MAVTDPTIPMSFKVAAVSSVSGSVSLARRLTLEMAGRCGYWLSVENSVLDPAKAASAMMRMMVSSSVRRVSGAGVGGSFAPITVTFTLASLLWEGYLGWVVTQEP